MNIDIEAAIIGDGKYLSYFKELTNKLRLTKNITFYGHIQHAQLNNYIKPGDIGYGYMPNELTTRACSNVKVFQYMRLGAIPLVSNVGDLPLYTFEGRAGYIVANASLIEGLVHALANNKEKNEKIAFIQKNAAKKYSWSMLTRTLERMYKSIK